MGDGVGGGVVVSDVGESGVWEGRGEGIVLVVTGWAFLGVICRGGCW